MAQIYYPKKTTTKLTEGAVAGLMGGAVMLPILALVDALMPERSWWTSISLFGAIFTGVRDFNTTSPDVASLVIGALLILAVFALAGMGFVNYIVLFRRFKFPAWVGGALYGALIGGSFMFLVSAWWPDIAAQQNLVTILISSAIGGVVIGWWLSTRPTSARPA